MKTPISLKILKCLEHIFNVIEFLSWFAGYPLPALVAFCSLSILTKIAMILEDKPTYYNVSINRLIVYTALSLCIMFFACVCLLFSSFSQIILFISAAVCFYIRTKLGKA